jgi:hypothetical protein
LAAQAAPAPAGDSRWCHGFCQRENKVITIITLHRTTSAKTRATATLRQRHIPPNVSVHANETLNAMTKFKILILVILMALNFVIFSCNSKNNNAYKINTSAYNTEIFESQFKTIYGSWKLQKIQTGWGEIAPDFDYLVINPFGTFSILRNDTVLANGKIEIVVQDKKVLDIKFVTNSNRNLDLLSVMKKQ